MHIERARVMNYKCIEDSGWVDFEEDLTRFVGANEAGKTSFLEAVADYKSTEPVSDDTICRYRNNDSDKADIPVSVVRVSDYPYSNDLKDVRENPKIDTLLSYTENRKNVVRFADGRVEIHEMFDPEVEAEGEVETRERNLRRDINKDHIVSELNINLKDILSAAGIENFVNVKLKFLNP